MFCKASRSKSFCPFALTILTILCCLSSVTGQQTTSFTYQGRLTDNGSPANGNYDLQFALFDSSSGGAQIGSTLTRSGVLVSAGIFTVQLDFTVSAFPGADRFLEIGVGPAGAGSFTILAPRQQISSTPYAIRTLNAGTADSLSSACVACVQDAQISSVAGGKVNGTIPVASVPGGSGNYIQNTTSQQSSANFNISDNGTAGGTLSGNVVNAATQYNLNGNRALSNPGTNNLFVGAGTGQSNTTGSNNAFVGVAAGQANLQGKDNAFFGFNAGKSNTGSVVGLSTTGSGNSFFGSNAGAANSTGSSNSFFGANAGTMNTTATTNSFFGASAGFSNTIGTSNSFFGYVAGQFNTTGNRNSLFGESAGAGTLSNPATGSDNAFFGYSAGHAIQGGSSNSFFGSQAGQNNAVGTNNSFFGYQAGASQNGAVNGNSFFGSGAGQNLTACCSGNSFFGFQAGQNALTNIDSDSFFGFQAGQNTQNAADSFFGAGSGQNNTDGSDNSFFGFHAGFSNTTGKNNTIVGVLADVSSANLNNATAIGSGAMVSCSHCMVLGDASDSSLSVGIGTAFPNVSSAKLVVDGGNVVGVLGRTSGAQGSGVWGEANTSGSVAVLASGTSFFAGDSTPLSPSFGKGVAVGYGSVGYLFAFDYGTFQPKTLAFNSPGGNVGIGTASPDNTLTVNGSADKPGGGSWGTFSDERLKNLKGRFSPGLKAVMQLQPLRYEYKRDNALGIKSEGEHIGFSAQAVQKIIPEAVTRNDKDYLLVNNDPIMWSMLNAIKEQQQEIQQLKKQVRRLQARRTARRR